MKLYTLQYKIQSGWDRSLNSLQSLDSKNTVVFIFGSPLFQSNSKPFDELKSFLPNSLFIGSSSSGEIFDNHVYDESLSVAILQLQHSQAKLATIPIADMTQSLEVGYEIAKKLNEPDLVGIFVVSDGLKVNGSNLIQGMNKILNNKIITGGLAGDGSRFRETWVLQDGKPKSGYVTAIGFYGKNVHIGHGSQGGWDIFGPERVITKSEGNILFELDGEPALDMYKQYLGEKANELPASALLFPLQIRSDDQDDKKIVRTILGVDESKKAMIFAGNIPQGALAQLMRANFERLIDGASTAATQIPRIQKQGPLLAIAVSCVGRRLVLGERIDEEVFATLSRLPKATQQIGFYSYGEISPLIEGQSCELHNQTMTLTTFSEDEAA